MMMGLELDAGLYTTASFWILLLHTLVCLRNGFFCFSRIGGFPYTSVYSFFFVIA
jgi:hypothetical protein